MSPSRRLRITPSLASQPSPAIRGRSLCRFDATFSRVENASGFAHIGLEIPPALDRVGHREFAAFGSIRVIHHGRTTPSLASQSSPHILVRSLSRFDVTSSHVKKSIRLRPWLKKSSCTTGTKSSTLTSSLNWMQIFSSFAEAGIGFTSIDVQPLKIRRVLAQQAVRVENMYFISTIPV